MAKKQKRKSAAAGGLLPGVSLERLVSAIERATQKDANVRVESPKFLIDKDTGEARQHDVVLTFTGQHHTVVLALECRDRKRKVGVPDVEAFHSKCLRSGVNRGVIISTSGFAETALKKAASYDIGCLTLKQAEGFNWCLARGIDTMERRLQFTHIRAIVKEAPQEPVRLFTNNGELVDDLIRTGIGRRCLDAIADVQPGTGLIHGFRDPKPAFFIVDASGQRRELEELRVHITFDIVVSFVPFSFRSYIDRSKGKELYTVASARIEYTEFSGELVMVHQEGGEIVVGFQPDAGKKSPKLIAKEFVP